MDGVLICRKGHADFALPKGHTAELRGERVILEAESCGGEYLVEGIEVGRDGKTRIRIGQLEAGWWNGAQPGDPCEYPFPEFKRTRVDSNPSV
jgi:hypothetical protein